MKACTPELGSSPCSPQLEKSLHRDKIQHTQELKKKKKKEFPLKPNLCVCKDELSRSKKYNKNSILDGYIQLKFLV